MFIILIVILVAAGAWFLLMKPAANNTTVNNTTPTINTPNTPTNQSKNQTNTTNTTITSAKAKELAGQYVGMGVTLETPTLTTYKGVSVWKVPVVTYSPDKVYLDPIYINSKTGQRVT